MSVSKVNGIALASIAKLTGRARASIAKFGGRQVPAPQASIVTANLIHHLDAGDSSSYSGSGTTWYDLTNSNVDGAFRGSPTYSSTDGGGSFYFDGVDDAIKFDYDDAATLRVAEDSTEVNGITNPSRTYGDLDTDGGFTIQCWVKCVTNNNNAYPFMPFGNNNSVTQTEASSNRYKYYQGLELTFSTSSDIIMFVFAGNGGNASSNRRDVRTTGGALYSYRDSWVNVAVTIADDQGSTLDDNIKIYIQGSEVAASSIRSWSNYNEGSGGGLGYRAKYSSAQSAKYHAGIALRRGSFLRGYLSKQMVYADVLTAAEILQNYDATKTRYGYS